MASPASVLAVVRTAAPRFHSRQQQLAYGVHAAVLGSGYRLVGVGDAATLEGALGCCAVAVLRCDRMPCACCAARPACLLRLC